MFERMPILIFLYASLLDGMKTCVQEHSNPHFCRVQAFGTAVPVKLRSEM